MKRNKLKRKNQEASKSNSNQEGKVQISVNESLLTNLKPPFSHLQKSKQ